MLAEKASELLSSYYKTFCIKYHQCKSQLCRMSLSISIFNFPLNEKSLFARTNFCQTLFSSLDTKHVKASNTHPYLKIFAHFFKQYFELRIHILKTWKKEQTWTYTPILKFFSLQK